MDFQSFDAQLKEDVQQIQMITNAHPTEDAKINRAQSIASAAAFCLMRRIGPMAAAHWLHQIAARFEAEGRGNVH